jgi:undecaprenyl-diphosphatase
VFGAIVKSLRKLDEDGWLLAIRLLIIVLGTWAFIQLAHEVTSGATQHFDEGIVRALRMPDDPDVPRGPAWFQEVARDITALGGYAILIVLVGTIAGFLQLDGKKRAMWFLLGAVLSGYLVGMGLKSLFLRPRPSVVPHLAPIYSTSFPSGHSMMSAIVYLTLGALLSRMEPSHPRLRVYFIVVPVVLTGLVGASRVYLGVHYPTDVLAGWTAGLVWATLCSLIAQRLQRRGVIEAAI